MFKNHTNNSSKLTNIILTILTLITGIFLLAIAFNWVPALRGPDDWRWTYVLPRETWRQLIPIVIVGGYVILVLVWGSKLVKLTQRREGAKKKTVVGFLVVLAFCVPLIQLSLLAGETDHVLEQLYFRTVSWGSSGFFSTGSIIDHPRQFLADYPALMPTFPVHPQRYPPGIPLLFYGTRQLLNLSPETTTRLGAALKLYQCQDMTLMRIPADVMASTILQILLPFLSGLTLFPLFGLARRTINWETAVWTAAIYPLVPSFALWAGKWDQFFPLMTVTAWYLLVVGLTQRKWIVLFLAGLVMALATFLSFGLIAMLMPMGLWALLWIYLHREQLTWKQVLRDGALYFAGFAIFWLGYQLFIGSGLLDIWRVSMSFHLNLNRGYWTWLGYHLYDFGIFLSLPIAFFCLFGIFYSLLTLKQEKIILPIAFGLGLLLLDVADVARGEVARVWIFLTPFAAICAAWGLTILAKKRYQKGWVLALVAVQLLVFSAVLRVVNTGLESVAARTPLMELPVMSHPLDVTFGEDIRLIGYDLDETAVSPEETITATIYWQPVDYVPELYTVFAHLVSADGTLAAQKDNMPVNNTLPTTCWVPNEIIADPYQLTPGAETDSGEYILRFGVYDPATGIRLPVTLNQTPSGDYYDVTRIEIQK